MVKIHVDKIVENVYVLRLDDDQIKYFEALWSIPEGITYNSYIMIIDDKVILFDTWKHKYSQLFIDTLKEIIDPRDIDYVVVHHMEPDHSGSLPELLRYAKNATVIGHPLTRSMISSFYGIVPRFKHVRDGDELAFKDDIKLKYIYTPWLHWPETIMTYSSYKGILFSCDAFGGFSIPPSLYDEDEVLIEKCISYVRKYFVSIIGRYRKFVIKNIDKINSLSLDIKIIAPAHGIIWKYDPMKIVKLYYSLAHGLQSKEKVLILYSSMYGFVEKAMDIVIDELKKNNVNPIVFKITDTFRDDISDVLGEIGDSSALIIGTATYESNIFPLIKYYIDLIIGKASMGIPVLIISSYGWGGVAGELLSKELSSKGFNVLRVVEFRGMINTESIQKIRVAVNELINAMK